MKEEDEATHYEDARTGEGRRRLSVCARDLYRLVDRSVDWPTTAAASAWANTGTGARGTMTTSATEAC